MVRNPDYWQLAPDGKPYPYLNAIDVRPVESSHERLTSLVRGDLNMLHTSEEGDLAETAAGAACLRINPGNIGSPERVREVIKAARDHNVSMRIGVNAGSLERHLLEKYG